MGTTYKTCVQGKTNKSGEAPRFVRIKSYGMQLQDVIQLCDQKLPTLEYIKTLKDRADNKGLSTTYYFPMPTSIDDDSSQSWDKGGIISDAMTALANNVTWLQAYTGVGVQPYYSQTYMGQVPRTLNLTFLINVETKEEFTSVNKMLLNLKYDMNPGLGKTLEEEGITMSKQNTAAKVAIENASYIVMPPPRLFDIQFGRADSHINKIIRYDLCALQSMDINYGSDGFLGLHTGAVPKYISINMSFAEFEPKEKGDW